MKIIIATFFILTLNAQAGFIGESKINSCLRNDYSIKSVCESAELETCYENVAPNGECGILKFKNIHSSISVDEESCLGESCLALHQDKVCSVNHSAFINEDYTAVYCREIIGKELIVDPILKAQKDAEKSALAQANAIVELGARGKADCEKVLNLVRGYNLLPERAGASESMKAEFSAVMELLEAGQPKLAKRAIINLEVDGVLVTHEMKEIALNYLSDWEAAQP